MALFAYIQLGIKIECSPPKCHPEIAWEGAEYKQVLAKDKWSLFSEKKRQEFFLNLVQKCMDNNSVLDIERIRAFG